MATSPSPGKDSTPAQEDFELCLSGGGFRAALFHYGVVLYLAAKHRLSSLKSLHAVSGGAITAAHLVTCWDQYCQSIDGTSAAAFGKVGRRLILPIRRRSFRNSVVYLAAAIWAVPLTLALCGLSFESTSIAVSAAALGLVGAFILLRSPPRQWAARQLYSRLFGFNRSWARLPPNAPHLNITATDLITGRLGVFSADGFLLDDENDDDPSQSAAVRQRARPIAEAVAASAGFPPAFPPFILYSDSKCYILTDGGVFDNLGIHVRSNADRLCIVSNASGQFVKKGSPTEYNLTLLRNVRANDIVMSRLATTDLALQSGNYEQVAIAHTDLTTPELDRAVRFELPRIRTDLNNFSRSEIVPLVLHGIDVANAALSARWQPLTTAELEWTRSALHSVLNETESSSLEIEEPHLRGSAHVRLTALWPIVAAYALVFFSICYWVGGLPDERVVGTLRNALVGSPRLLRDSSGDVAEAFKTILDNNTALRDYWATVIGTKDGSYYKTTQFAAPAKDTAVSFKLKSSVPLQGEDVFAVLVPSAGPFRESVWLRASVIRASVINSADDIVVVVPAFSGRGSIVLFVVGNVTLNSDSTWQTLEKG